MSAATNPRPIRAVDRASPEPNAGEHAARLRRDLEERRDEAREQRQTAQESRRMAEQRAAQAAQEISRWTSEIEAYDVLIRAVVDAAPRREET